jgi:hypothetical protein
MHVKPHYLAFKMAKISQNCHIAAAIAPDPLLGLVLE